MKEKQRIGVIFGGQSLEHSISLQSARSVITHLNREKYEVIPIGIDRRGGWHLFDLDQLELIWEKQLIPVSDTALFGRGESPLSFSVADAWEKIDVIFPVLHGPFGEDGTVQGLLRLANLPFVGSRVLSSALCMDKGMTKKLLLAAGIPVAPFHIAHITDPIHPQEIIDKLGLPLFVKPVNLGSSIGISKVKRSTDLLNALNDAFRFDERAMIETFIDGREIECAILGNLEPQASLLGEVIPKGEFYSYQAKYFDSEETCFKLPARLPKGKKEEIQQLAIEVFKQLQCAGMARVDFFLCSDGRVIVNELNTIPGFTKKSSLYPKLWEISGVPYKELLDKLIELALEQFKRGAQKLQGIYP